MAMEFPLLRYLFLLLLHLSLSLCDFQRTHDDYDPNPINMEMGWGATHCLDFQEVSTLWRPITFEPALVVTCELRSHQCVTIRAVNSTHYYTFQGCLPQARVSRICSELAYESAQKNGAEYFYCYDVSYDRLNVPTNVPLAGRECCCNGDFCNRIENVMTIDTIIPHDQILDPYLRTFHLWYWNLLRTIALCSFLSIVFFWTNIVYIVLKPAARDDDSAWYSAPISRNQLMDDDGEDDDDDANNDAVEVIDVAAAEAMKMKDVEVSKKKKKDKKRDKKRATKEEIAEKMLMDCTQDCSIEEAKTGEDGGVDEKKDEKKEEKRTSKETAEKEKKDGTPVDAKEKKTQEAEPKKEEKEEEPKMFKLPKPKKLANGRIQMVSMFNENSDYSDED